MRGKDFLNKFCSLYSSKIYRKCFMDIFRYIALAKERGASDVHLIAGQPPVLRVSGQLMFFDHDPPLDTQALKEAVYQQFLTPEFRARFEELWDLDFGLERDDIRLRINLRVQKNGLALSARLIPLKIPSPEDIDLSQTIQNLVSLQSGLILLTGPSGCGKSTTMAVLIDLINKNWNTHIITLEDPIEFVYSRKKSIIEQRELSHHARSFGQGLKYALRQDPNVLMVGEMRDLETMSAVLTAAETGHLVFSTLHTPGAAATIERIVDCFPPHQQRQVLLQLSSTLRAVISQQLFTKIGGGIIVAREVLMVTPAVANLIRENKIAQICSVMQTSGKIGMMTMEKAVKELIDAGLVDKEEGQRRIKVFGL